MRRLRGREVAPAAKVPEACGVKNPHVGRDKDKWQQSCPDGIIFEEKRKATKNGGSLQWLASLDFLEMLYGLKSRRRRHR